MSTFSVTASTRLSESRSHEASPLRCTLRTQPLVNSANVPPSSGKSAVVGVAASSVPAGPPESPLAKGVGNENQEAPETIPGVAEDSMAVAMSDARQLGVGVHEVESETVASAVGITTIAGNPTNRRA